MNDEVTELLLKKLVKWLDRVEHDNEEVRPIAVSALFIEMNLLVQVLQKDPEGWKYVANFIQRQSRSYMSHEATGCLDLLGSIAQLFVVKP